MPASHSDAFVFFGATGDLAYKQIFPALQKNRVTDETIALLVRLAGECGLAERIDAMFSGATINVTERRAALHVALRAPEHEHILLDGAGVHYWGPIADRYGLNLTIVNEQVDPTFRFMSVDWDGQIRMDPSSPYAMQMLLEQKGSFDVAFACDTDHDRHGIVTRETRLLPPNHYLTVLVDYLYTHRPKWPAHAAVGKTIVSSRMIDRVSEKLGRGLYEVPDGFKWFVGRLLDGSLGFAGAALACAVSPCRIGWRKDRAGARPRTRQSCRHWRHQSHHEEWLVCRASFGNRRYLQDLRGEFPRRGSPGTHRRRGPSDGGRDATGADGRA